MEIKDVIGAILSDLASARNISDLHSRRLVNYYRQDSLLRYFPVPRAEIKSVNIEMKFAVKLVEEDSTRTSTKKGKINNVIEKYTFELVNQISDVIIELYDQNAPLEYIAGTLTNTDERQFLVLRIAEKAMQKLGFGDSGDNASHKQFVTLVTDQFRKKWPVELALQLKSNNESVQGKTLESLIYAILKDPVGLIMDEILKISKTPNDLKVELIFEADKLQELHESCISSVNIVSEIRNYNWQKVGEKDNKPEHRLEPE